MDKQQRQYIILGVLVVAVVGVVLWNTVLSGDPAAGYQYPDAVTGNTAASTGTNAPTPVAATTTGAPVTAATEIAQDEIDLDQLIQSVKKVSFDYAAVRIARNPMTPLVGRIQRGPDSDRLTGGSALIQRARSMLLTGIIWNPGDPLAVLDNNVVTPGFVFNEGDAGGIIVETIEPNRVILRVEDQLIPLNLEEQ